MLKIVRRFLRNRKEARLEQNWYGQIDQCGNVVTFKGRLWEWIMWKKGKPPFDYELFYAEIPLDQQSGYTVDEILEDTSKSAAKCDCGGTATGGGHAHWCSTQKENDDGFYEKDLDNDEENW